MAIINFDRDTVVDYLPAYGGNRDSTEPCVVRIRFVPYARVRHYSMLLASMTRNVTDSVKIAEITQGVQKRQFVENVESVSNYFVGGREVTTAEEFYETADTDLVMEVIRAMENTQKLTEGQKKNS